VAQSQLSPEEMARLSAKQMEGYRPYAGTGFDNYGASSYGQDVDPYSFSGPEGPEGGGAVTATAGGLGAVGDIASSIPHPAAQGIGAGAKLLGKGVEIYGAYKADQARESRQSRMERLAEQQRTKRNRDNYRQDRRQDLGDISQVANRADSNEQYRQSLASGYNKGRVM
jgi:hypothetical protein